VLLVVPPVEIFHRFQIWPSSRNIPVMNVRHWLESAAKSGKQSAVADDAKRVYQE
jgi:hypothetical protein